jgi:membrane protease YdiL (CAAX protease family)
MYLLAVGVHILLTSRGSPKEAWLIRVYLQIGDPQATAAFYIGPVILLIAAAEELVWRGLVMGALADKLPPRRALLVTTALYALIHASTLYLLRDPYIGWNPLVVAAALGCGLVWGWIALAVRRLSLSMVAHALFTWSVVEFPIMNM